MRERKQEEGEGDRYRKKEGKEGGRKARWQEKRKDRRGGSDHSGKASEEDNTGVGTRWAFGKCSRMLRAGVSKGGEG